jgi:hypothetical protein
MLAPTLLVALGPLFFVEAQPGIESGEQPGIGPTLGIEAGVGGSWRGSRPRFFLVVRGAISASTASGTQGGISRREYDDVAGGLRLLVPIVGPLRLYAEMLAGATVASASLERHDLPALDEQHLRPLAEVALGASLRLSDRFSVGVRGQLSMHDQAPDAIAAAAGVPMSLPRAAVATTLTFHF